MVSSTARSRATVDGLRFNLTDNPIGRDGLGVLDLRHYALREHNGTPEIWKFELGVILPELFGLRHEPKYA
jgi:hypothetical protein